MPPRESDDAPQARSYSDLNNGELADLYVRTLTRAHAEEIARAHRSAWMRVWNRSDVKLLLAEFKRRGQQREEEYDEYVSQAWHELGPQWGRSA